MSQNKEPVFDEPWQAQILALADALVKAGHISAPDWAKLLGEELKKAEKAASPDTLDTYYLCVLEALEKASETHAGVSEADRMARKTEWEDAYHKTPHGQPVEI